MTGQTCTVATRTSLSGYGVPSFSTSVSTLKCRWVEKRGTFRDAQGGEINQRGVLWVMSTSAISPDSKVTLPDGTAPPILAADAYPDEVGRFHHVRVTCGY